MRVVGIVVVVGLVVDVGSVDGVEVVVVVSV